MHNFASSGKSSHLHTRCGDILHRPTVHICAHYNIVYGSLVWLQLPGREAASLVITFAQKTLKEGQVVSKLHVIELGGGAPGKGRWLMCLMPYRCSISYHTSVPSYTRAGHRFLRVVQWLHLQVVSAWGAPSN